MRPLFRIRYAKRLAAEFNGRYDSVFDTFIFEVDGKTYSYRGVNHVIKGRPTKLYPIGSDWDWTAVGESKIFEAYWGDSFWLTGKFFVTEDFFAEGRCYDPEEVAALHSMPVGADWQSTDYGSGHTVTRLK